MRTVRLGTRNYLCSTQGIDGLWQHLRSHFWINRVSQQHTYRYLKEFQLKWNCSRNEQNLWATLMVKISSYFFPKVCKLLVKNFFFVLRSLPLSSCVILLFLMVPECIPRSMFVIKKNKRRKRRKFLQQAKREVGFIP